MLQDARNMRNEQQSEIERMKVSFYFLMLPRIYHTTLQAERSREVTTNDAQWAKRVAQSAQKTRPAQKIPSEDEQSSSSDDIPATVERKPKRRLTTKKGKKSLVMERLRKKHSINNGGAPTLEAAVS